MRVSQTLGTYTTVGFINMPADKARAKGYTVVSAAAWRAGKATPIIAGKNIRKQLLEAGTLKA